MIFGIKENKCFENVIFTYVVDSDQTLSDWANNIADNDYSCVLVKQGVFTTNKNLNLTATKTKVIIGEVGSKLVFNIPETETISSAISYTSLPEDNSYFMQNVHVVITRSVNSIGFNQCVNMFNCSVKATGNRASCFYKCENLFNCEAKAISSGTDYTVGFYYSNGIYNCVSSAESNTSIAMAFSYCEKLFNCEVKTIKSNDKCYGFHQCKIVNGCTCENDSVNNTIYGFYQSEKITSCIAVAIGLTDGKAFYGCDNVVSSQGSGQYGYYECTGVINCLATNNSVAKSYNSCANLGTYNASYACANTPEGGFNF